MKRLHLLVGALTLFLFLLTGQYMDYLEVRTNALGETARVMFRSRHIYLLLAGLVNLGLGAYFAGRPRGWPRALQLLGSALVVVAPALMLAAFFTEPGAPGLRRHFTLPAVIILAAGTLLHALSGLRSRETCGQAESRPASRRAREPDGFRLAARQRSLHSGGQRRRATISAARGRTRAP